MKILSVEADRTAPVLLLVSENGGEPRRIGITAAEYTHLGSPPAGCELPEETAALLLTMDEGHRAVRAAARILEFGDNNRATLRRKLRARGFSPEAAERAVGRMVERGYLREGDQLERAVLAAARKRWGPRRIAEALAARGFDRAEVKAAITRLSEAGEIDFTEGKRQLLAERATPDMPPEKKKALLYRFGY